MKLIELTPSTQWWVGNKFLFNIGLISASGRIIVSGVTFALYAKDSNADVLSTYASGAGSFGENNVITPLVGVGSGTILPGEYTLFAHVTYNGGLIASVIHRFEFLEVKG